MDPYEVIELGKKVDVASFGEPIPEEAKLEKLAAAHYDCNGLLEQNGVKIEVLEEARRYLRDYAPQKGAFV